VVENRSIHTQSVNTDPIPEQPGHLARLPLYFTQVLAGVTVITLGPLLDSIMRDLHVPVSRAGFFSMGFFLGRALGVVVLNAAFARIPLKRVLAGSCFVQAAGLVAAALLAHSLWPFFAMYFVVGIAGILPNTIPGMWLSAHARKGTGGAMMLMLVFFAFGTLITPWVFGSLVSHGVGWRAIFIGEAIFSIAVGLVVVAFPLADISGRENIRARQVKGFVAFRPRLLALMGASLFLYIGSEVTFDVWLPKFQMAVFHSGATWAGLAVTFFSVGILAGRLLAIPLSRRFSASRLVLVFAIAMAVFGAGIAVSPSLVFSPVLCFAAGVGASALWPLVAGYSSRFPEWHAGVAYSALILCGCAGAMIFPYLVGPAAEAFGFRAALGIGAATAAAMALLSLLLHRAAREEGAKPDVVALENEPSFGQPI
jgi:MFS family permease